MNSSEEVGSENDSENDRNLSPRIPSHIPRLERRGGARDRGHGAIRKQENPKKHVCDKCMDTTMVGLCNQIGTTAFYLANKLQGKKPVDHGGIIESMPDRHNEHGEQNLSHAPAKTQSTLLAPTEEVDQARDLYCKNRVDLDITDEGNRRLTVAKRCHRLKLDDIQKKLANCTISYCSPPTSIDSKGFLFPTQGQASVSSGKAIDARTVRDDETVLCPTCGCLSSTEECENCLNKKEEQATFCKSNALLLASNSQQANIASIEVTCSDNHSLDTDKSANANTKGERDVYKTVSETEILDYFDVNITQRAHTKKPRAAHVHGCGTTTETTVDKLFEGVPQGYERIGKRLSKKHGHTYIQKSTDPKKNSVPAAIEPAHTSDTEPQETTDTAPQETTDTYKAELQKLYYFQPKYPFGEIKMKPDSKRLFRSLPQEFGMNIGQKTHQLPTDSQVRETLHVSKNEQGSHSTGVSDMKTKNNASNDQSKQLANDLNDPSGATKNDNQSEKASSPFNFVGSSVSLEADTVYKRSTKKGSKETFSKSDAVNTKSDGKIAVVDDGNSCSVVEKFINPLAIDSIDSLYRGSTLSLDVSEEAMFMDNSEPEKATGTSNDVECDPNCPRPSLQNLEEHQCDEASVLSMQCHTGNISDLSSMGCGGESDVCRSASCNLSDSSYICPGQETDKSAFRQRRLYKPSRRQYGLLLLPETSGCNVLRRHGHRRKRSKHDYEVNKPMSADMGVSPERVAKKHSGRKGRNHKPDWYKLAGMASKLLDICSEGGHKPHHRRDKSKSSKSGRVMPDDLWVSEKMRILAAKACVKKIKHTLASRNDSATSDSTE